MSDNFKVFKRHANVLQKGLTFVPVENKTPKEQYYLGIAKFIRSLKIKTSFIKYSNDSKINRFQTPSNFTPHSGCYPPEIDELEALLNQEVRNLPKRTKIKDNLSKHEKLALKELKDNGDLVIKPADKGSAIVLMDKKDYIFEAERQLAVKRHYRQIPEPQYPKNCEIFNRILSEMKLKKLITEKELNYLRATRDSRERIFYLLPKIHKESNKWTVPNKIPPGRPIVSDVNSESYAISKFIDFHLAPFAKRHASYIKNTYDFLDKLKQIKTNPDALLISCDVDSLYTNIDNEMGIRAVQEAFAMDPKPIHRYIIKLLRLSLEGNDFTFNNKHYLQVSGTAMGKKFAPHYADICMAYWETMNLQKSSKQPKIYLRYLDDIFLIWEHDRESFDEFFNILNSSHPNIKLKTNIQENELEFLDVLIYKGEIFKQHNTFDSKVFFKPTDSHALLHKHSFHPKHTFAGIVKSQLTRFARICQLEKDFDEATKILFHSLYSRAYSRRFLRKIKTDIKNQYFPDNKISGMNPCKGRRCTICKHVNTSKELVTSSYQKIRLFANGNCNTDTAIYVLGCKQCPHTYYVGQTTNLRDRFIAHLSSINNRSDKFVHQHFTSANHSSNDVTISILEIPNRNNQQTLNKLECQWIKRLNSYHSGLNSDEGNKELLSCIISLQHNPTTNNIVTLTQNWIENLNENNSKNKKNQLSVMKASARNKNLSQKLVRAVLK